jgi:hypothetical protein
MFSLYVSNAFYGYGKYNIDEIGIAEYMAKRKRLLILGPAFRRRKDSINLQTLDRYNGLFYRVAKKYLTNAKDVDVVVMKDDLTLIDGSTFLPYVEPEGIKWGITKLAEETTEKAKKINEGYLKKKLAHRKYFEVFISMGKAYAAALPIMLSNKTKVIFPTSGGPGPKAQALKEWLKKS